jgi:hypothetical protein
VLAALQGVVVGFRSCSVPVKWSISHEDRLVLASAEGEASMADLEEYISAVVAAGAMPYRKLFDTTYIAPGALRLAELRAILKEGPRACQGGADRTDRHRRRVGTRAGDGRSVRQGRCRSPTGDLQRPGESAPMAG